MANTLAPWLRGREVFTVTLQGQTADSVGALSVSGALRTLTAIIDEIGYSGRNQIEEISAITAQYENNVIVEKADQIILREILRQGQDNQLLAGATMLAATDFCLVTIRRGYQAGTTGGQTAQIDFYGTMLSYVETFRKGKSVGEMTIGLIDRTDAANPLYAMTAT